MKNIIVVLILACLLGANAWGQGFMKSYNINNTSNNNGVAILADTLSYTIVSNPSHSLTGYVCAGVINTNTSGVKQWDSLLESQFHLYSPNGYICKSSDSIYTLSGGLGYFGSPWQIFFSQSTTQNISQVTEYGDLSMEEVGANIIACNDTLITAISYGDVNPYTYHSVRLLKMCIDLSCLENINLYNINNYVYNNVYFILNTNENSNFYLSIGCKNSSSQRNLAIRKINSIGNVIWEYLLDGYTTYTNTPTQIAALSNGNIVTRWFDESNSGSSSEANPYLLCLNSNSGFVWRYDFNDEEYEKFPVYITATANGDIIGCGYSRNPNYNYDCAWLFRISPEGELLWEREYISHTPMINFLVPQGIDEDSNGNIIATGAIIDALPTGGYEGNAFLLKVLPNGCFTPDCNGGAEDTLIIASTVVGVEQPPKLPQALGVGQLAVFPNPASNSLQILLPNQRHNAHIQVTDILGRSLKNVPIPPHYTQTYFNIDTHDLPNGTYLVQYTTDGIIVATAKVVVQH